MAQGSLTSNPNSNSKKLRNGLKTHSRGKMNPYANYGLDKFSALLTDLEEKRQKIYAQNDSQDIVMVRFAYKNSNECVPVVVKQNKDRDKDNPRIDNIKSKQHVFNSEAADKNLPIGSSTSEKEVKHSRTEIQKRVLNLIRCCKPAYHITVIVIFILFMLAYFGTSVAILGTCLVWYLVPVLKERLKSKGLTKRSVEKSPSTSSTDGISRSAPESESSDGGSGKEKDRPAHVHGRRKTFRGVRIRDFD